MKKCSQNYDLDDPRRTLEHHEIIMNKPFLKKIYIDWYNEFIRKSKEIKGEGIFLEIGSGGGFLKEVFPEVVTSDILELPTVDKICSAEKLPFEDNSIRSIMMLNVFHHIPRPYLFLREAQRTLIPVGRIIMIEPANTLLSRFIYKRFHHEPFIPDGGMEIESGNPLSNSNQALPYIYFEREKDKFDTDYPLLKINSIRYHTPFRYAISGGLSKKAMLPDFLYGFVKFLELLVSPFAKQLGLFCSVEIEKINGLEK